MTADFVLALLLGHLVGDYLLRNDWMALRKNQPGGWWPCTVHASFYTLAVVLFTQDFRWQWVAIVFASHWPIDRWSLANYWRKYVIHGSKPSDFFATSVPQFPDAPSHKAYENYRQAMNGHIFKGSAAFFVYVLTDNTMHLVLMYGGWHLLRILGL